MRCNRSLLLLSLLSLAVPAAATEGLFIGADLGASEPVNANYRGHVETGLSLNPFVGYMFNRYLGAQGEIHFVYQNPETDTHFEGASQSTTLLGATVGPRLAVPLLGPLELYGTAQGGGFTGLSGRVSHTAGGFSVGPGLDLNVSPSLAIGVFARWNYAFTTPSPKDLGPNQVQDQRGANDIRWVVAGLGLKISFPQPEAPPPPPPPPPVVEVAPKRRIILRAVYFDFDKSNIRPDAAPVLDEAVDILKSENLSVVAEGHTDGIGTVPYNQKLSERRAASVKKYMVGHGIAADHIETIGYGKLKPIESNDTAEGRAKNRRVELQVK